MFKSRFKVVDRNTNREIENAFVLFPESDGAARTALAAYAEATINTRLAHTIRGWLLHIHKIRVSIKTMGRGEAERG